MENYKLAILYGKNDLNRGIKAGQIERLGGKEENEYHSPCLLNEANKRYPDKQIFQNLSYRHRPEVISYFFTLFDNIVFLNTTKHEELYGKTGIFIMPNEVSDELEHALNEFADEILDFEVNIFYELNIVDGILEGKEILAIERGNLKKLLSEYFKRKKLSNGKIK